MKKLKNWSQFYNYITESTGEIKTRPNDPYEYKVENNNWLARRKGTTTWYEITGKHYLPKYQPSIDKLDTEFPTERENGAPRRNKKNQTPTNSTTAQTPTNSTTAQTPTNSTTSQTPTNSIAPQNTTKPTTTTAQPNTTKPTTSQQSGTPTPSGDAEEKTGKTGIDNNTKSSEGRQSKSTPPNSGEGEDSKPQKELKNSSTELKGKELYDEFKKKGDLIYRNSLRFGGKKVIIYKGEDLKKEDKESLENYLKSLGYAISIDKYDHRKGEKIMFKPIEKEKQQKNREQKSEPKEKIKFQEYERSVFGEANTEEKAKEQAYLKYNQYEIPDGFEKKIINEKPTKLAGGGIKYEIRLSYNNRKSLPEKQNTQSEAQGQEQAQPPGQAQGQVQTQVQGSKKNNTQTEKEISQQSRTVSGQSNDQSIAQRKALQKYNQIPGRDGVDKRKIKEKTTQKDGKYTHQIEYEIIKESRRIYNFGDFKEYI